jgi:hypothetical protein
MQYLASTNHNFLLFIPMDLDNLSIISYKAVFKKPERKNRNLGIEGFFLGSVER